MSREHVKCCACGRRRAHAAPHPAVCPSCGTIAPWVADAPFAPARAPKLEVAEKQGVPAPELHAAPSVAEVSIPGLSIVDLGTVDAQEPERFASGYVQLDRVLGNDPGGFARGRIVLVQARRGTGKSRMLTRVCSFVRGLFVDVEEDSDDAKLRWARVAPDLAPPDFARPSVRGLDAVDLVIASMRTGRWPLVVVNSLQGMVGEDPRPQGVACDRLADAARATRTALVLVSQMNGQGEARGSKQIEQWVDTIAEMTRPSLNSPFVRFGIVDKNRGGPTDLVAWFEHKDRSFAEVEAPT